MTPAGTAKRLPAAERRRAVLDAALRVFAARSYAGATTAEIAREAGVSEPILYRHFESKCALYVACLDRSWSRLRAALDARVEELGPEQGVRAIGEVALGMHELRLLTPNLWIQALSAAAEDKAIRRYLRRHMREVHDHVAGILRGAQEAGGVPQDRDADAEAWIFIANGLLASVADRLGGVLGAGDIQAVARQRHRWLTGAE